MDCLPAICQAPKPELDDQPSGTSKPRPPSSHIKIDILIHADMRDHQEALAVILKRHSASLFVSRTTYRIIKEALKKLF